MYDAVISGAGPSGCQCAEVLAKAGYKVALIEKDTDWRKPCGGGVGAAVFKYYPQLRNMPHPKIRGIKMYSASFNLLDVNYLNYDRYSTVMDRLVLDNMMRDAAVTAGAELFDKNISIDFIIKDGKKAGIKTKTNSGIKEYLGNILVIAEGMSSRLAIKSGLREKWKSEEIGMAKCEILEGDHAFEENTIYVWFRPYMGYAWLFPLGDKRFNIGCGTFGKDNRNYNLNTIYQEFLDEPKTKEFIPGSDYKQIWVGSFPVPSTGVLEKSLVDDNLLLIGDCGGFVSPISGEGIHPSVASGKIAAETVINALEIGDYSSKTLKGFRLHPNIKKIARSFKFKRSMVEFFYENKGENLNKIFKAAEEDDEFKQEVADVFLFNATPSKEFMNRIISPD